MSDTPKTDAVAYLAIPALGNNRWAAPKVVPADFARAQERTIAMLIAAARRLIRAGSALRDEQIAAMVEMNDAIRKAQQ